MQPGRIDSSQFVQSLGDVADRYFCDDSELFYADNKTYAFTNQWGLRTEEAVKGILAMLPADHGIEYEVAD